MRINIDFSQQVILDTNNMSWINSPMQGVQRKMLDRIGAESGHATSIVRYAPNSHFSAHIHEGGEEYLVLEGTFSDEHGDFPAGSYVRNPIGSQHTPFSKVGCTIFVKLFQFNEKDTDQFVIYTQSTDWEKQEEGIETQHLHHFGQEAIQLIRLQPHKHYNINSNSKGSELFVLEGTINENGEEHGKGTWIRNPTGYSTNITAVTASRVYVKIGHLSAY